MSFHSGHILLTFNAVSKSIAMRRLLGAVATKRHAAPAPGAERSSPSASSRRAALSCSSIRWPGWRSVAAASSSIWSPKRQGQT